MLMALFTSNPELASMQIPRLKKYFKMLPFGLDFMAYRTVRP